MNNTLKKTLASFLTVAMLATGTTLLTSCKGSTAAADTTAAAAVTSADSSVVLTQDAGATDATAAATTAAPVVLPAIATATMTIDGKTVSAAEYDFYYYSNYRTYAQYASYGAVPTLAADGSIDLTAVCSLSKDGTQTWGDFIKESAKKQLQDVYILTNYAAAAGVATTAADQKTIDSFYASVQKNADSFSMSADEYLTTLYGASVNKISLDPIIARYLLASDYMSSLQGAYTFTDAEMQTFYTANKDSYKNIDVPTVRHILFLAPVGASGYTDATPDELAAAKALAEATLAKIKTYDDMVTVGDAAFADGSALESAEYSVAVGSMVKSFEDWCYDAARKPGDTGIVQSEYGYHVMYYVKTQKDWVADAIASLTTDKFAAYIAEQEALPQFAITQN
ncbi:MAG: peptidylprolyl isomerase [Eubacteriales bacterium]